MKSGPLRICLCSRQLSPFEVGGVGTYAQVMCRSLADAGHDVHLVTARYPGLGHSLAEAPGVHVHPVDEASGAARFLRPDQVRYAFQVWQTVRRLDAEAPFDVIEFPEYDGEGYFCLEARRTLEAFPATVLAVKLHTPSLDVRELDGDARLSFDLACIDHLESRSIAWADVVLSGTQAMLDRVRERQPIPRFALSPYPLDPVFAGPRSPAPKQPEILYLGRLERRKGVELLVRAVIPLLQQRPGLTLRLIGGDTDTGPNLGSMRTHLRRLVPPALEARVLFEGERPREELPAAVQAATVCCFPSVWENYPYTCLGAMAAGAAVVASDAGGMAEMIEDGESGLLFRSGDAGSLRAALGQVLDDPDLRDRLGAGAPERLRRLCAPPDAARRFVEIARATAPVPLRPRRPTPSVAVIVPVFEMGALLDETLASVRAQTRPPEEVIVVDDGSTGAETMAALARAERGGARVIRQSNQGLGAARNTGIQASRSTCVLPLDSDDLLAPGFLARAVGAWEVGGERSVVTSLVSWFVRDPEEIIGGWFPWGVERDVLAYWNIATTPCALIPRAVLDEIGGYDTEMYAFEDWDLNCRLALAGVEIRVIPEFLFRYRQRPRSMLKVQGRVGRERLVARMIERYPALPLDVGRTLRLYLSEACSTSEALRNHEEDPPLRYRLADAANAAIKRLPLFHGSAKWLLRRDKP